MKRVTTWERLLDSLDSTGGHIFILFSLVLLGVAMVVKGVAKGEDVLVGSFGALLAYLSRGRSNYTRYMTDEPETPPPAA